MSDCLVLLFAAASFSCVVRRVTDKVRLYFGRMFPVLLQAFCRLILNIFFVIFLYKNRSGTEVLYHTGRVST